MRISSFNLEFLQEYAGKHQKEGNQSASLQQHAEISLELIGNNILLQVGKSGSEQRPASPEMTGSQHLKMARKHSHGDSSQLNQALLKQKDYLATYIFNRKTKIFIEHFEKRYRMILISSLIFFTTIKSRTDPNESVRNIVLELEGERFPLKELRSKIATRNSLLYYRDYLAFDPAKIERPSYFSYENSQLDLRGFFNLAILLMFANNFMLIIENFMQYGFLLKENVA